MFKNLFYKITKWRLKLNSQRNFLIYCSALAGLLGGLAAVALKFLVHFMEDVSRSISAHLPFHFIYVFLPALGILFTVIYTHLINRDKLEKGIGSILVNIKRNRSNIAANNMYAHLISSSLTVGFGGSSGLEAPIVCTGAALGSNTGRFFKLTSYEKMVLIGAGASAGIAAVFNSPIAGVLFSLELLIGEITTATFIPLLIASATGVVVSKVLYSRQLFHLATDGWVMAALPFYILLALLCGCISVYIANVGGKLEKGILPKQNRYVRAIIGGLLLGIIILVFPPLFGEGYHDVQEILNGNIEIIANGSIFSEWLSHPLALLGFIALLVFLKIIATGITIGSGGNGGTFAPTMFTGAFLGLFIAYGINQTGLIHLNTSNFIAAGMAGALSGVLHAPLTAIFLIAEITGGYVLFIPLMIVSAISYIISRYFNPHNMYWHHLVHERNIRPDHDDDTLYAIPLDSVINRNFSAISKHSSVKDFYTVLSQTQANIFPVLNDGGSLEGVVLLDEIRKQLFDTDIAGQNIADIMIAPPAVVNYGQSVTSVMALFDANDVWQLPVVKDDKFIGFISKSTLLAKYREVFISQHRQADPFAHY
ncbi:chloride channel protein [Mucilaginibacter limnophilus]|uniref:Chloride channel protein n=1 Tax=Mucilaginibacter limnophilus TaxID=1932778 RepID=A0A437MZA5_9SPHI|nr:chloride channel protein [Mucilaginibacter limnophilus]RVU02956.1 chloride channel protein [Mucilaginibacter limnophilus]